MKDKIQNIIDELLDIIDSLAYDLAVYKYPTHYDHSMDKNDILSEYEINKILKEINKP